MKFTLLIGLVFLVACTSAPQRSLFEAQASPPASPSPLEDENIVKGRYRIPLELRTLQNEVYEAEAQVFGGPDGEKGLYGSLKECRENLAKATQIELHWNEDPTPVTANESDYAVPMNEKELTKPMSKFEVRQHVARFQGYKNTITNKKTEYHYKLRLCQSELASLPPAPVATIPESPPPVRTIAKESTAPPPHGPEAQIESEIQKNDEPAEEIDPPGQSDDY